MLKSFTTVVF